MKTDVGRTARVPESHILYALSEYQMEKSLAQHYNADFYADQIPSSVQSAKIILSELFKYTAPNSILDIGCGKGTWLAAAESLGVTSLHGIDGPWVTAASLLSKSIHFKPANMEQLIPIEQRYDLAISVEVAEHISLARAPAFVGALCDASDVVMFGAAVVGQGGENHVNEQRQSFWVKQFELKGYQCFDVLRPAVWDNEKIAPWYRQNTLVFVNSKNAVLLDRFAARSAVRIIDLIHPEMFEKRVASNSLRLSKPTLRFCLSIFKSYLVNLTR